MLTLSGCGSTDKAAAPAAAPATTPAAADPSATSAPSTAASPGNGAVYVAFSGVVPADRWDITDAARRDDPKSADQLDDNVPGLDWSAQYQDGSVDDETKAPYLMVSEFSTSFDDVAKDVAGEDAQQSGNGDVNGHRAIWGLHPDDDTNT